MLTLTESLHTATQQQYILPGRQGRDSQLLQKYVSLYTYSIQRHGTILTAFQYCDCLSVTEELDTMRKEYQDL